MIKLILNGANGKMGQTVASLVAEQENMEIIFGADVDNPIENAPVDADVILDFSISSALPGVLGFALKNSIPLVLATTGYTEKQIEQIEKASKVIPILRSATMSIGANLLMKLSAITAEILGDSFDVEILEKHHNQKLDSPSGVALALANSISNVKADSKYIFERASANKKREKNEIGIASIRGGSIIGEHTAIFAGPNEVIELTHKAQTRGIFAHGALKAVEFIVDKPAGIYDMQNVILTNK